MRNSTLKKYLDRLLEEVHLLQGLTLTDSENIELKLSIAEDMRVTVNKLIRGYRKELNKGD